MVGFALGAGRHSVVHVLGDILGDDDSHRINIHTKHGVELFLLAGTWLANSSPALLIKPYQLLGEKHV
jgi:hypothetical protein